MLTEDVSLDQMPLERLEAEICSLAAQVAAATCRFLLAVAVYDRREGWRSWECRSMVHFLAWRCGISPVTARDQVRVASALGTLPTITAAFAKGELSYSQVRALSRVATPATDEELLGLARAMTAAPLERLVSAYRGVRAAVDATAGDRRRRRVFHSFVDDDGMTVTIVRQPPEDGTVIAKAVEAERQALAAARGQDPWRPERPDPDGSGDGGDGADDPFGAERADALLSLVVRAATTTENGPSMASDTTLAIIHVSAEVVSDDDADGVCHLEAGPVLAPETARRLTCDGSYVEMTVDGTDIMDVGRSSRRLPTGLRRALLARDQGCVFPGCDAIGALQAHHVRHWGRGGPTSLGNLCFLCSFHHHRLHEGGGGDCDVIHIPAHATC